MKSKLLSIVDEMKKRIEENENSQLDPFVTEFMLALDEYHVSVTGEPVTDMNYGCSFGTITCGFRVLATNVNRLTGQADESLTRLVRIFNEFIVAVGYCGEPRTLWV